MDPEEFTIPSNPDPLGRLLEQLQLCTEVIKDVHYGLEPPQDPDNKADLLLTVEALTLETLDLLETTKRFVWGPEPEEESN